MSATLTCKDTVGHICFSEIPIAELPKGLEWKPNYRLHFVLLKRGRVPFPEMVEERVQDTPLLRTNEPGTVLRQNPIRLLELLPRQ